MAPTVAIAVRQEAYTIEVSKGVKDRSERMPYQAAFPGHVALAGADTARGKVHRYDPLTAANERTPSVAGDLRWQDLAQQRGERRVRHRDSLRQRAFISGAWARIAARQIP